jgi:hypothetical protein
MMCAAKVASDAFTTLCKAAKAELPALANAAKAMMIAIGVGVGLVFPQLLYLPDFPEPDRMCVSTSIRVLAATIQAHAHACTNSLVDVCYMRLCNRWPGSPVPRSSHVRWRMLQVGLYGLAALLRPRGSATTNVYTTAPQK